MSNAQEQVNDGRNDFDFFIGKWQGHNRRLKERLKGCTEWEEFEGMLEDRKVLGGLGNVDEATFERASGTFHGMTVRLFNPKAQEWSLHWADSSGNSSMDYPTIGSFKNGRGEFYDLEPFEGKATLVRFIWSDITPTSCHWEQAFSADGGRTWETNWTMDWERINE